LKISLYHLLFSKPKHMLDITSLFYISQEKKEIPQVKKDDQKAVDAALIKAIEAVPELKTYLGARFSLKQGMKPHELVF